MKSRLAVGVGAAVAALALAVPVAAVGAAEPGQTVTVKQTISVNAIADAGKVTAKNANCVERRRVVVKQVGVGLGPDLQVPRGDIAGGHRRLSRGRDGRARRAFVLCAPAGNRRRTRRLSPTNDGRGGARP